MVQIRMQTAASLLCPQQSPLMDNQALLLNSKLFQHRTPGATTNYLELAHEVESSSSAGPDEK